MLFAAVLQSMSLPPSTAPIALGRDVEFGTEAPAAQFVWRALLRITPDGDRTVVPRHRGCRQQRHGLPRCKNRKLGPTIPNTERVRHQALSAIDSGRPCRVAPSASSQQNSWYLVRTSPGGSSPFGCGAFAPRMTFEHCQNPTSKVCSNACDR